MDYVFTEEDEFLDMVERGELAEWARVHGRLYGTPVRNLEEAAARGEYPLLDIDVQGARQIRERLPSALLIFVLPPSSQIWIERLTGRGTEDRDELEARFRSAVSELEDVEAFDAVVLNDDLDETVSRVRRLIEHGGAGLGVDDVRSRVQELRAGVDRVLDEWMQAPNQASRVRGLADREC